MLRQQLLRLQELNRQGKLKLLAISEERSGVGNYFFVPAVLNLLLEAAARVPMLDDATPVAGGDSPEGEVEDDGD